MIDTSVESIASALTEAGIEIYRQSAEHIQVAERVRMHLMDSGVMVALGNAPVVSFAVRCQRSDFPVSDATELFERARAASGPDALAAGFAEIQTRTRHIHDPMDEERILDTWLEVVFERRVEDPNELTRIVSWALSQPKYVQPG